MTENKEDMNNTGLVSVIMGIYNCASTLPQAIDSILSQTYTNWELILCDDASTDNTYEIAKQYKEKYPSKIVLIRNEVNSYLSFSLNHCLQFVKGIYVARMDGDDISVPTRFEKQVNYLQTHPEIQLVGSGIQWFDTKNGPTRIFSKPEHPDKWILHEQLPFFHPTIMTYKSVYDTLGGYTVSEKTRRCEDYDLWFRFFAEGMKGDNITEPLYLFREDENAINRRSSKSRWNAFSVAVYGYKLLDYPKTWLVRKFLITTAKSITPYKIQAVYREWHKKQVNKN